MLPEDPLAAALSALAHLDILGRDTLNDSFTMADISARCNGLATVPCLLCVFHRFQLPLGAGLS